MGYARLWKPASSGQPTRQYRVIKNSEVIKVGDWITDEATGAANIDANTEDVLGYATAIVTPDKKSFESATVDSGDYSGTWVASTKQYTAAGDNATVDKVMVEYIPVRPGDQFIAILDANKGTTTGSNLEGYFLAILTSDSSKLDESSASTSAANTQFVIKDPYNQGLDTEVIVEVHDRMFE